MGWIDGSDRYRTLTSEKSQLILSNERNWNSLKMWQFTRMGVVLQDVVMHASVSSVTVWYTLCNWPLASHWTGATIITKDKIHLYWRCKWWDTQCEPTRTRLRHTTLSTFTCTGPLGGNLQPTSTMLLIWTTAIVRVYMPVRKSSYWRKHVIPRYDGWRCTHFN